MGNLARNMAGNAERRTRCQFVRTISTLRTDQRSDLRLDRICFGRGNFVLELLEVPSGLCT
jgi:hypothetical protein